MPPEGSGMKSIRIPVNDSNHEAFSDHFSTVLSFFEEAESEAGKVLIHCQEGKSRSCTFAIAYIMKTLNMTLKDALREMKTRYAKTNPSVSCLIALSNFEYSWHQKRSIKDIQSTKPTVKECPLCGISVGLSNTSLALHIKKHKSMEQEEKPEQIDIDSCISKLYLETDKKQ